MPGQSSSSPRNRNSPLRVGSCWGPGTVAAAASVPAAQQTAAQAGAAGSSSLDCRAVPPGRVVNRPSTRHASPKPTSAQTCAMAGRLVASPPRPRFLDMPGCSPRSWRATRCAHHQQRPCNVRSHISVKLSHEGNSPTPSSTPPRRPRERYL